VKNAYIILIAKPEKKRPHGRLGDVDDKRRIVLKQILYRQSMKVPVGFIWLRISSGYQCNNEISESVKGNELLHQLNTYQLFKKILHREVCE
jgi:hypothetical protein